jgi:glutathionylspermidine synthase
MKRISIAPRENWKDVTEKQGLIYNTLDDGSVYWDESGYYEFSSSEVDEIERVTYVLHQLYLDAAQHIIDNNLFDKLKIPSPVIQLIKDAWEKEPPALYGRMDLGYDGKNIKLLEYNADTPTALVEASVIQWYWLQDRFPMYDQFNSLHDKLVAKWTDLKDYVDKTIYFAHLDNNEDFMTVAYLAETAQNAGLATKFILMSDIGWDEQNKYFVDLDNNHMATIFKLYPYEWLIHETFAGGFVGSYKYTEWIEPVWKMLWSNKAILAILWELNPNHPNLLPTYFDSKKFDGNYVKKPIYSREGANIEIFRDEVVASTGGDYGEEGFVYQQLFELPEFDGNYPVLGSWMIDQDAAGMGIRESKSLITDNRSRFVPHLFK